MWCRSCVARCARSARCEQDQSHASLSRTVRFRGEGHPVSAMRTMPTASRARLRLLDSVTFYVAFAVAVPALLVGTTGVLDSPDVVDEVTFENSTRFDVTVRVDNPDRDAWMPVVTVRHGTSISVVDVLDHGDVWRFRFEAQTLSGGELALSRRQLEARGWHVVVPKAVGDALTEAGAPPSP